MGLLGLLKAFLVVALIRISPSVGDGIGDDIVDLSTVSELLFRASQNNPSACRWNLRINNRR